MPHVAFCAEGSRSPERWNGIPGMIQGLISRFWVEEVDTPPVPSRQRRVSEANPRLTPLRELFGPTFRTHFSDPLLSLVPRFVAHATVGQQRKNRERKQAETACATDREWRAQDKYALPRRSFTALPPQLVP